MSEAVDTGPLSATVRDDIERLVARHRGERGALLPLLHAIRDEIGHVPDAAVPLVAQGLNLSRADVHGVLTFYHDFRRAPAGRHVVKLCRAEACQARGGVAVERAVAGRLGVPMGETRGDVTLEPIYCLGLCASGPAALVDGRPIGNVTPDAIAEALSLEGEGWVRVTDVDGERRGGGAPPPPPTLMVSAGAPHPSPLPAGERESRHAYSYRAT